MNKEALNLLPRKRPTIRWVFCLVCAVFFINNSWAKPTHSKTQPRSTGLNAVLKHYGPRADRLFKRLFNKAHVAYPPKAITLLTFKREAKMELWAKQGKTWHYIKTYPLKANSGGLGPKLHQGDMQIPEGIYHISVFNPYSHFHLSMKVDYPNRFDRQKARAEHRSHLGGDIFIHGKNVSAGCLAIGDKAIEELFVLATRVGKQHVKVIIEPYDMRHKQFSHYIRVHPPWLPELYHKLQVALGPYAVA